VSCNINNDRYACNNSFISILIVVFACLYYTLKSVLYMWNYYITCETITSQLYTWIYKYIFYYKWYCTHFLKPQGVWILFVHSQGPRHTKRRYKMVPVVPLFSIEHSKGKILALSEELT